MEQIENTQKMKLSKSFRYPMIILLLLVISSIALHGCRPDDVIIENNGELCDTCVIAFTPVSLPIKSTEVKHN